MSLEQHTDRALAVWEGEGGQTPSEATKTTSLDTIAVLGNHLPRHCGIATFTTDLSAALASEYPQLECFVLAMNDARKRYAYPARVRFELSATDLVSYRRAADFLNVNTVDLLSVQHEYGIFGGKAGSYVLALLAELRMPIVTTLHTILATPDPLQRAAMDELTRLSERVVVMSEQGRSLLRTVHNVPASKIDVIPHGIPSLPCARTSKARLGLQDKRVLLTFGLLSPDKGIEHVIDGLPAILARFPNAVYVVLGATHPHVREHDGETYRVGLENRARQLGVAGSMIFHDRFVSQGELVEFLSAADIYITPYLNPEQITSGTLAYALGAGKAVISTPYSYARELLAKERGVLVPWPKDDPDAIGGAVIGLLGDDERRAELQTRGAAYGRNMLWPAVASSYVQSFERASAEHADRLQTGFRAKTLAERPLGLPEIDTAHLARMSDHTGILQHALFSVPRYEHGYCLDDNARALLLITLLEEAGLENVESVRALGARYLAFVSHALDADSGRFRNFMSYARQWAEGCGSEDSQGRALWALGSVIGRSVDPGRRGLANALFHASLGPVEHFSSPRAWAYTLLGIDEYLGAFRGDTEIQAMRSLLLNRLYALHQHVSTPDWPWFEDRLTYCNARLSQALLLGGWRRGRADMVAAALRSLEWLAEIQTSQAGDWYFTPIGSNGFFERGQTRATFDQQPVEACAMVSACLLAQRVTGEPSWALEARRAFNWFTGQNQLQCSLYDAATGGCRDGLHPDRPNENQGAESTLSFLTALLEMRAAATADLAARAATGRKESTS
jgi:glycosyltransferase involved in cell wall biosynthesis